MPTGPPELRAVGADAEAMRRALLVETDAARAADEGLTQESPVVAALRADLATDPDPVAPRLRCTARCGRRTASSPATGGASSPLDGGRTALLLLDVAGHGELAGLVLQRLRSVLTVSLRSGFDPGTVLTRGATSFTDAVGRPVRDGPGRRRRPRRRERGLGQRGPPRGLAAARRRRRHGAPGCRPPDRCSRPSAAPGRPRPRPSTSTTCCSPGPTGWSRRREADLEMSDDDLAAVVAPAEHAANRARSSPGCSPSSASRRPTGAATTSPSSPYAACPEALGVAAAPAGRCVPRTVRTADPGFAFSFLRTQPRQTWG